MGNWWTLLLMGRLFRALKEVRVEIWESAIIWHDLWIASSEQLARHVHIENTLCGISMFVRCVRIFDWPWMRPKGRMWPFWWATSSPCWCMNTLRKQARKDVGGLYASWLLNSGVGGGGKGGGALMYTSSKYTLTFSSWSQRFHSHATVMVSYHLIDPTVSFLWILNSPWCYLLGDSFSWSTCFCLNSLTRHLPFFVRVQQKHAQSKTPSLNILRLWQSCKQNHT